MSTFFNIFLILLLLHFTCINSQWTTLTKYVVNIVPTSWDNAQLACNSWKGTSLASIHNQRDQQAAKAVCPGFSDCAIGLRDQTGSFAFAWIDGTTWDFGTNTNGGVYPWAISNNGNDYQPDNVAVEYCVNLIDEADENWNNGQCSWTMPFICNEPSELCQETNWQGVNVNWEFVDSNANCDVINYNDGTSIDVITLNIHNNTWKPILMEYMYKINGINNDYNGQTGILININGYDMMTRTYSFYIGINVDNDGLNIDLFIENNENILATQSVKSFVSLNGATYYQLRIEFDENSIFNISLNDKSHIISDVSDILPLNYYIDSIGIQNINQSTIAKSLFINGETASQYFITDMPTVQPTKTPSKHPTADPTTSFPTNNPSTQLPTTYMPTTLSPTTSNPTTFGPTTFGPTTFEPTTSIPTGIPTLEAKSKTSAFVTTIQSVKNNENNEMDFLILFIVIGALIYIICLILAYFYWYKMKLTKTLKTNLDTIVMDDNNTNNNKTDVEMYPVISSVKQTNCATKTISMNPLGEGDVSSSESLFKENITNTGNTVGNDNSKQQEMNNIDDENSEDMYQNNQNETVENMTATDGATKNDFDLTDGAQI
eukprot:484166_1